MNKIKISVLMPTYNRGQFIAEALDSVIPQLTEDDEIIIMDDGSTDNTSPIVKPFLKDNRIQYFKKEHTNAPDSRNQAIKLAKNPWILWFDSDDILLPDVIKTHKKFLKQYPEVDVFYGDLKIFGQTEGSRKLITRDYYRKNLNLLWDFLHGNQIPNPGIFVRKSIYSDYGFYDVSFLRLHDYEYWVRTANRVTFKHIGRYTCKWRWHTTNMSSGSVYRDPSYDSRVLDGLISRYKLEDIFSTYPWGNKKKRDFLLFKAHLEIAEAYAAVQNYEKSDLYLLKSIRIRNDIRDAAPLLLKNFLKLNPEHPHKEIREYLERSISQLLLHKRMSCEMLYNISSYYKKTGQYGKAREYFLKLIKKMRNKKKDHSLLGKACFHLGEICLNSDKKKEALSCFTECCSVYPEHQKAREYLKQLTGP